MATTYAQPPVPAPQPKLTHAEAFNRLVRETNILIKGLFNIAREAIRQADAALKAVPELRRIAIDLNGDAELAAAKEDPRHRKKFAFAAGIALAVTLAMFDAIPANASAQALNFESTLTIAATMLFTLLLACVMFAAGEARTGRQRAVTFTFAAGVLLFLGFLRWTFAATMTSDPFAALAEAGGLMLATFVILSAGVAVLALTKSAHVSRLQAAARKARRVAEAKEAEAQELAEVASVEEGTFISVVIPASTDFFPDNENDRDAWIDYIRNLLRR